MLDPDEQGDKRCGAPESGMPRGCVLQGLGPTHKRFAAVRGGHVKQERDHLKTLRGEMRLDELHDAHRAVDDGAAEEGDLHAVPGVWRFFFV